MKTSCYNSNRFGDRITKSADFFRNSSTVLSYDFSNKSKVFNGKIPFLNAIGNDTLNISSGIIYNFVKGFAMKCDKEIQAIKEELMHSEVLHTDATVVTVNGKQAYIRNQSAEQAVLYSKMDKKSIESIKENSLLWGYKGILIHDHETSMYNFGAGHGECNVHLLNRKKI